MAKSVATASRGRTITLWLLRVLAAVIFLSAAGLKLAGEPTLVAQFDQVGLGQWLRYAAAILEVVGGIAVLLPRYSSRGAALLLLVDIGAFLAQVAAIHMDWVHPVVIGAILLALVFQRRWMRSQAIPPR